MVRFEQHGFLDTEARREHVATARGRHGPYFELMVLASDIAMSLLPLIEHKGEDQYMAALIFAKMIKAAQATVILCEAALPNEAAAVGRGVVEAAVALAGIRRHPGEMLAMFGEDDAHHDYADLGARADYARSFKPGGRDESNLTKAQRRQARDDLRRRRDGNIAWLEERRADILARYGKEPKPIVWGNLAAQAGATAIYNMSYRHLSCFGTHTTLTGLESLVKKSHDGNGESIHFSPDYDTVPSVLFHTAQGFISGIFSAGLLLGLPVEDDPRMELLVDSFTQIPKDFLDREIPG
ncbi:DUF5677 domain-containing protein [Herbaspirillum huttiense F1]|uniref:DUF5677 domain-containing protein n=1 Tax=Herbaspirillum huttiense TaxID=863372 RepID=UPI002886C22B|nr:DUF5677 domain-containing protein [Herbaspirillum huttiense]MDT0359333.1 DUF5677 domain-containing protein [Herbaspirillum huttiense F1]